MKIKNLSNIFAANGTVSTEFNINDFGVIFQNEYGAWSEVIFQPGKRLAVLYYLSDPEDIMGVCEDFDLTETVEGLALVETFEEGSLGDLLEAAFTYTTALMKWWR